MTGGINTQHGPNAMLTDQSGFAALRSFSDSRGSHWSNSASQGIVHRGH